MISLFFTLDHHIIDVGVYGDHSMVGGPNVLHSEGHDLVLKYASRGDKGSILLIRVMDDYLLVATIGI